MRGVMRLGVVLACALAAGGCGGGDNERRPAPTPPPPAPSLFEYDRSLPVAFADRGRVNRASPIVVRDVSYASRGHRVRAFLVTPPGRGPFPAVIYAHGSGEDRLAFVGVAAWIVARGAVAITVDQPSPAGPDPQPDAIAALRRQRNRTARSVVDFRRAIDVLASLPQVDEKRIGFVGFSAGARVGAILAGVEKRIEAYVLMSGGARPVGEYLEPVSPEARAQAGELLSAVDPLQHVARAAPAALLFQNGRRDELVPRNALEALAEAGSEPKEIRWYDAGHGLNVQTYRDQLDWLERELEIEGPPVRGASTGP
jgi:dienelactone hydrolase